MSENDDQIIAAMLNDVNACGMEINGIQDVFSDYFAVRPGDEDSDSDAEESVLGKCNG